MQDAFAVALERWPVDGFPDNPGAWITTTARNRRSTGSGGSAGSGSESTCSGGSPSSRPWVRT